MRDGAGWVSRVLRRLFGAGGVAGGEATRRRRGARAEAVAARWLRGEGYRVIGRNVVTAAGEADVVALTPDGGTLVVVEVKSRSEGARARPEEQVTAAKAARLVRVATLLGRAVRPPVRRVRVDVFAVEWGADGRASAVRHHAGAIGSAGERV